MRITVDGQGQMVIGEGVKFERIRRVTGYLAGTVARFNNAKRKEVADRVTHKLPPSVCERY